MLTRDTTLNLKQQVHIFLEWLRDQTKDPTNMINALTSVDLIDATLQDLQELLKGPPPPFPLPPNPNYNPEEGKLLAFARNV